MLSKAKALSQSSQRLDANTSHSGHKGKSSKLWRSGKKSKDKDKGRGKGQVQREEVEELRLPPAEAAFLPDFPLRGDLEDGDFEVGH